MTTHERLDPTPHRTEFLGGSVVQLVNGDPRGPDALVASLHPATVVVTPSRLSAIHGDLEWCWLVADLLEVHHSQDEEWSLLVVPGVPDHGVAVAPSDVEVFRSLLDELRGGADGPRPSPTATRPLPRHEVHDEVLDPTIEVRLEPPAASSPEVAATAPRTRAPRRMSRARTLRTRGGQAQPGDVPAAASLAPLEARAVSAWFGTHHVLDRVSLEMRAGEVTALIGPSGCGKSTFLRILNRMHELIPSASLAGEVLLAGDDIYDPARKLTQARREIGMVFQKPNPFPAMSIYDNVVASLRLTGRKIGGDEKDALVESCLSKAGLWSEVRERLRQPGGGLSGGQQQRLCIARALAIRPRVLLMDEPCSALDPTSTRRIEETIHELRSEVTIVIVTHNMQQAARVSDRCAFFLAEQGAPGVIIEHGPTDAMFHAPRDERTSDYVHGRFG